MKKLIFICIVILFAVNTVAAQETIRVSSPAPTAFARIENESLVGPSVEIMKIIFNELGVKVTPVALPWARAIKDIKTGQIDAIAPIFFSKDRFRFIEFSIVLDNIDTCVFIKKGTFDDFKTWNDLKNHQGIIVRGRSEGQKFDDYAAENLKLYKVNSLRQIIQMIIMDRADYGIDKYYDTIAASKQLGVFTKIQMMSVSVATNEAFIGISRKSPFLKYLPQINEKIKQLKQEGAIQKIVFDHIKKMGTE